MDPMEEQLDYEDEEYGGQKMQHQGSGAISALAEEEMMGEDDEYDDLYNDVNVGEGFLQQLHHSEPVSVGNGGLQGQKSVGIVSKVQESVALQQEVNNSAVGLERKDSNIGASFHQQNKEGFMSGKVLDGRTGDYPDAGVSQNGREMASDAQVGNVGFRGAVTPMPPKVGMDPTQMPGKIATASSLPDPGLGGPRGPTPQTQMNQMVVNVNRPMMNENISRPAVENGTTLLFVGELHWWTTDAELESVLTQYGRIKEIKFFDERASGKSKGYCQVEFFDPGAAAACKEGMNGQLFNGRACVVAFASPQTLKQMGASYQNKNQVQTQAQPQGRRIMNDGVGRGGGATMNFQGGDGGRNFGKAGWGRGGQGIMGRGQTGGGMMRGRGGMVAKNMVGNNAGVGSGVAGGNPYGQGLAGPAFGGPTGMMHPQSMMGAGFDPTYMGRGGGYGFPGPAFPGMVPSFQAVNTVGLPGVAPHVNPAFFGRGMTANGMGMMGSTGMEGHHVGMWADPSMGGWGGGDGLRTRESSYGGEEGASEYGYAEASHERVGGGRSNAAPREKERGSEREWSGNSERRHRDEKEQDWDRSDRDHRYKEEKDGYRDSRQRDRNVDNEDDWDRGQSSSRSRSKSRMMPEDDYRPRSRDADYGKRRRLPSEWLQLHLLLLVPQAGVWLHDERGNTAGDSLQSLFNQPISGSWGDDYMVSAE